MRDGAVSVSNSTDYSQLAVADVSFFVQSRAGVGLLFWKAGKAVLTFGGWIERLKDKRRNRGSHWCLPE